MKIVAMAMLLTVCGTTTAIAQDQRRTQPDPETQEMVNKCLSQVRSRQLPDPVTGEDFMTLYNRCMKSGVRKPATGRVRRHRQKPDS